MSSGHLQRDLVRCHKCDKEYPWILCTGHFSAVGSYYTCFKCSPKGPQTEKLAKEVMKRIEAEVIRELERR